MSCSLLIFGINYLCRAKVVDEKSGASGWVHMRQSVHNPNVAINMQSSVVGGCRSMAEALLQRYFLKYNIKFYIFHHSNIILSFIFGSIPLILFVLLCFSFFQKGRHAHELDITEVERLASEGIK